MADTYNSDDQLRSTQSDASNGSNQGNARTAAKQDHNGSNQGNARIAAKQDHNKDRRLKGEHKRNKGKQCTHYEDEQASTEHTFTERTDKSVKNKTKINGKSGAKKASTCDKYVHAVTSTPHSDQRAHVYHSSDDSWSSSQSNEFDGPNKDDATTSVRKGVNKDGGRNKDERKNNKSKSDTHHEDEQASSESLSTDTTNRSVKDKTKVNRKSLTKKSSRCDQNVQQAEGNPKIVHREKQETFGQSFDGFDRQNYHSTTGGGPASNYDSPPYGKVERSDKTKIKESKKKRGKSLRDIDEKNCHIKSKPKNGMNENVFYSSDSECDTKRDNSATKNYGIPDEFQKQPERMKKKGRASNVAPESSESETSESHSDTGKHENDRGRRKRNNERMAGVGSASSVKGHKSNSSGISNAETNFKSRKNRNHNSQVHRDENRSRDNDKSKNKKSEYKTDDSQRSSRKKTDEYNYNIDDGMNRGFNCATEDASGANKKKHSKKRDYKRDRVGDVDSRRLSDGSSCSSSGNNSSRNNDKTMSRSPSASRSRSGSSQRSSSSGSNFTSLDNKTDYSSQNRTSNSHGRHRGTDKSETSRDLQDTDSEGTNTRTSDRQSKKYNGTKGTRSDCSSDTSRRKERTPKKSPDWKETDSEKKAKGDSKSKREHKYKNSTRRRSVGSRSSSERRRSLSKEKSRDKPRHRERGKYGNEHGHRHKESERNYSSDDYNRNKKNRDRDSADKYKEKSRDTQRYRRDSRDRSAEKDKKNRDRDSADTYKEKSRDPQRYRRDSRNRSAEKDKKNRDRDSADKYKEKSRDPQRYRRDSRDRSAERERPRRRKSSASPIHSGKSYDDRKMYHDSPKWKECHHRRYEDEDSYERGAKHEQPDCKYEWQFENEHGKWITYGHSVAGRSHSDDIEKFLSRYGDTENSMVIKANNNQYYLDFKKMSQTNVETSVCRNIRRVRKSEKHDYERQKSDDDYIYVDAHDALHSERLGSHRLRSGDNRPDRTNDSSTKFEWQFEDDTGNWITYGKTNSARGSNTATSTTSDDIERFHTSNPSKVSMQIRSGRSQYHLNFNQMTQVNIETFGQRRIRRVPKSTTPRFVDSLKQWLARLSSSVSSGISVGDNESFEWQFHDERGMWITYGQVNPNGIAAFSTSATSDDIEKYYTSSPNKAPISISSRTHTYLLDFQNMVQINQETLVQRKIQRVKKTSNDRNVNQPGGVGQGGVPAGNGNSAGVINFSNPSHNPGNFGPGSVSHGFNQGDPRANHLNTPSFPCAWQFQDENGSWITYGQPSSTKQFSGSTTTSDDIEHYFLTNPGKTSMNIQSPFNNYVLDIQRMIQINQTTQAQKAVRRVMKQNVQPPPNFMM